MFCCCRAAVIPEVAESAEEGDSTLVEEDKGTRR